MYVELGRSYGSVERGGAQRHGAMGRVAHYPVQGSPNGREDASGRAEGGLLEGDGLTAVYRGWRRRRVLRLDYSR